MIDQIFLFLHLTHYSSNIQFLDLLEALPGLSPDIASNLYLFSSETSAIADDKSQSLCMSLKGSMIVLYR